MLNSWTGTGRLTRDPEVHPYGDGKELVNITIAIDRDYRNADGDYPTDFVPVTLTGPSAQFCKHYLSKGRMVSVQGRLQQRSWTDSDGARRTAWSINGSNIWACDSRRDGGSRAPGAQQSYAEISGEDDELPF